MTIQPIGRDYEIAFPLRADHPLHAAAWRYLRRAAEMDRGLAAQRAYEFAKSEATAAALIARRAEAAAQRTHGGPVDRFGRFLPDATLRAVWESIPEHERPDPGTLSTYVLVDIAKARAAAAREAAFLAKQKARLAPPLVQYREHEKHRLTLEAAGMHASPEGIVFTFTHKDEPLTDRVYLYYPRPDGTVRCSVEPAED